MGKLAERYKEKGEKTDKKFGSPSTKAEKDTKTEPKVSKDESAGKADKHEGAPPSDGKGQDTAKEPSGVGPGQVLERHKKEREEMHGRHRAERRDLHGNHKAEHDKMHGRHQKEHDDLDKRHMEEMAEPGLPQGGTEGAAPGGPGMAPQGAPDEPGM